MRNVDVKCCGITFAVQISEAGKPETDTDCPKCNLPPDDISTQIFEGMLASFEQQEDREIEERRDRDLF